MEEKNIIDMYTLEEVMPWCIEFVKEIEKERKHEIKCKKIKHRQKVRRLIRYKIKCLLISVGCILIPILFGRIVEEMYTVLLLSTPLAALYFKEFID